MSNASTIRRWYGNTALQTFNHGESYDVVRKILGHADPNAVKHYARVDIEKLREHAIAPASTLRVFSRVSRRESALVRTFHGPFRKELEDFLSVR